MSYAQLTFQLSTATGALCSLSDTFCCSAGRTWLRPSDTHRSGESRAVTASDKREEGVRGGERQGDGDFGNASLTLNALWRFSAATPQAISCIWHMHLHGTFDWRRESAATFLSELLLLVRLQPRDSQKSTWRRVLQTHNPRAGWRFQKEPNYCLRRSAECILHYFFFNIKRN